jgi:Protein of unknown function (DUF3574)
VTAHPTASAIIVTPRFPDGFTIYDADGQWLNPQHPSRSIAREKTKVIEIATEDTPEHRDRIYEIRKLFRDRFNQLSVGLVTNPGCGAFGQELPPSR